MQLTAVKELKAKTLGELFEALGSLPSLTVNDDASLHDTVGQERDRIQSVILKKKGGYEAFQAWQRAKFGK